MEQPPLEKILPLFGQIAANELCMASHLQLFLKMMTLAAAAAAAATDDDDDDAAGITTTA